MNAGQSEGKYPPSMHGSKPSTRRYVFIAFARTTRVYLVWYLQFRPYMHDSPYFFIIFYFSHVQINAGPTQSNPTPVREAEAPRRRREFCWKRRLCVLGPQSNPIRWHTEGRDRGLFVYIADRMPAS